MLRCPWTSLKTTIRCKRGQSKYTFKVTWQLSRQISVCLLVNCIVRSMFPVPSSAWFLLSDMIAALQKCVANEVLKQSVQTFNRQRHKLLMASILECYLVNMKKIKIMTLLRNASSCSTACLLYIIGAKSMHTSKGGKLYLHHIFIRQFQKI